MPSRSPVTFSRLKAGSNVTKRLIATISIIRHTGQSSGVAGTK